VVHEERSKYKYRRATDQAEARDRVRVKPGHVTTTGSSLKSTEVGARTNI